MFLVVAKLVVIAQEVRLAEDKLDLKLVVRQEVKQAKPEDRLVVKLVVKRLTITLQVVHQFKGTLQIHTQAALLQALLDIT